MNRTYTKPFTVEHLRRMRVAPQHLKAWHKVLESYGIQQHMAAKYAVTFLDSRTDQVLGCFGVLDATNECWAFLNRRLIDQDCYTHQRIELVRECKRILEERERNFKAPALARVDGIDPRDEKFLETIGFKRIDETWYQKGDWFTMPKQIRGQQLDLFV
jgi:hypothetical protein